MKVGFAGCIVVVVVLSGCVGSLTGTNGTLIIDDATESREDFDMTVTISRSGDIVYNESFTLESGGDKKINRPGRRGANYTVTIQYNNVSETFDWNGVGKVIGIKQDYIHIAGAA
jgi:hypothetical protein